MRYIVDKPFQYCGHKLRRGDVWTPQGYPVDRLLIKQQRVHAEETESEPTPAEPKPRGRQVPA
jgi:hypothetical protein